MRKKIWMLALLGLVALLGSAVAAEAGTRFSFSFGFGRPYYYGPYSYWTYDPGYYYAPYPAYVYQPYYYRPYYPPVVVHRYAPFVYPAYRYAPYRPYVYRPYRAPYRRTYIR